MPVVRRDTDSPLLPDELMDYAESLGHGALHIKMDKETGLRAIISIHNTNLGPALGGCRFIEYDNASKAIYDAMRLARGMSYKSSISNLKLGGGKAVIMRPKAIKNREALMESFGAFVDSLNGRYITAVDSGTSVEDMDIIHRKTPYVTSTSRLDETHGDPSFSTAYGVYRGILAAVKFRLGQDTLEGIRVAIQGTGHVGYPLAKHLHQAGAKLIVCDMNSESAKRCADEFGAQCVDPADIYGVDCDIFAPCALGAVINRSTVPLLKAKIVAGSANNQLAEAKSARTLMKRNILYVPDYVINAGGIIEVASIYYKETPEMLKQKVHNIYDTVMMVLEQAHHEHEDPALIADAIACKRIYEGH